MRIHWDSLEFMEQDSVLQKTSELQTASFHLEISQQSMILDGINRILRCHNLSSRPVKIVLKASSVAID